MYENVTFEMILQRMLERIPDSFDKREGSVIYDALAPAAVELQNMYIAIDTVLNESFADTQSRPYLIKRCAERDVIPKPASYAIRKGEFNIDVPIGSRFSLNTLNYVVLDKISDRVFRLQCETIGVVGNLESGQLIPIEYINGLETAMLTDVLIPAEDEEETEKLRQRYFDSFNSEAFGGNIADYKEKAKSLNAVGGVKVKRAWNGGGTVKLVIISSEFTSPSSDLIKLVQEKIDPPEHHKEGLGLAPIDHEVTVVGCGETPINIMTKISFQDNYTWEHIKDAAKEAIDKYFNELAESWEESEKNPLVVRISQIETRLLDIEGVLDIENTKLDAAVDDGVGYETRNITLDPDNIPILGGIALEK